ncbi:hypothetical protein [Marinobacter sp.]|uniref:DUF7352 domain-containing protein n=1 Tax=Marinobacter sp. TaxID=50741 RepID=UPI0035639EC9
MKTIDKYLLCFGQEPTALKLMPDFQVVFCEYLVGAKGVYLWVEQSPVASGKATTRRFIVARPGKSVPDHYEYVDSAVDPFGSTAHHVFQLPVKVAGRNWAIQSAYGQASQVTRS